jgi:Aminoacyl-tRNA editing domain
MTRKEQASETLATSFLRRNNVEFTEHLYDYVEHGGTAESSRQLGIDEHQVVKTLVLQDQDAHPLLVLMHGDRKVSLKNLARQIGAKSIQPCTPKAPSATPGIPSAAPRLSGPVRRFPFTSSVPFFRCPKFASMAAAAAFSSELIRKFSLR